MVLESIRAKILKLKPLPRPDNAALKQFYLDMVNLLGQLEMVGDDMDRGDLLTILMKKILTGAYGSID